MTSPVLEILAQPIVLTNKLFQKIGDIFNQQQELSKLRTQNTKLLKWQAIAKKLKYENKVLRKLIKLAPFPKMYFITAQVIASSGGTFSHNIMINAGKKHGVQVGQAVVTHRGLVGRIVEVSNDSSRVLLVTDMSMRVPAVLETTRARTIIGGNNTKYMQAHYLPKNEKVSVGDRVVSSFEGGVFPPNIVIGRIVSVSGERVMVKSLVKWSRLEFVQVIQQKEIKEKKEKNRNAKSASKIRANKA